MLVHGWTNLGNHVAMALRKLIVKPFVGGSNYSCFTATLKFPAQSDCITHFLIAGSRKGVQ